MLRTDGTGTGIYNQLSTGINNDLLLLQSVTYYKSKENVGFNIELF